MPKVICASLHCKYNGCDYKKRSGETLLNSLKLEKRNVFGEYTEQLMYADRNSYDTFGFTEDDLI